MQIAGSDLAESLRGIFPGLGQTLWWRIRGNRVGKALTSSLGARDPKRIGRPE